MLQSLDTLIGFVVILLAASLLVTIIVQMLSSAFALRGKNLGNALALAFQSIDSTIGKDAYSLAERILSDPRLSDSTITRKTVGGQSIANQKCPWSWWSPFNGLQLTNAIRTEEIYDLLQKISAAAPPPAEPAKEASGSPTGTTAAAPTEATLIKTALIEKQLGGLAKQLVDKIGVPHGAVDTANKSLSDLLTLAGNLGSQTEKDSITTAINTVQASLQTVAVNIKSDVNEFDKWFAAAQDRAQQWFQMHTRIFTIISGIVLAFLLQLDTVEIFKFVSTNATARAALAGSADKLVEKADGILEKNGSLLDRIYGAAKKQMPGIDLPKDVRSAATNSAALKKAIQGDRAHNVPGDFDTKYDAAEKEAIDAYYKDRREQMDDLTKGVAATGFRLMPNKFWHRWDNEEGIRWDQFFAHFWGMAITAGLLSLGAPYWYNILKDLTSLRPAVSKLIGQEKAAETQPH